MQPAVCVLDHSYQDHATDNIPQCGQNLKFEELDPCYVIGVCIKGHKNLYGTHYTMMKSGNAYYKCHQEYHHYAAQGILR